MKKIIFLIVFLLISSNTLAGFQPITVVRPDSITTTTDVMLGFDPLQYPCLRPLPNFLGQTHLLEMDENNNINFSITAWGTDPCLNIPLDNPPYEFFNLGSFPEGIYQVQLIWVGTSTPLPVPKGGGFVLIGEVITFEVSASVVSSPTAIPVFNFYSLIFLVALIMIFSLFHLRKKYRKSRHSSYLIITKL